MKSTREQLPVIEQDDGYENRATDWGEMTVAFETVPSGTDFAPMLVGLPDDACQCPHWGYLFRGCFTVHYVDGAQEQVTAGQAYYLSPGHRPVYDEECVTLEFSPTRLLQETLAVVRGQESASR